jgi:hypothetical protein
MIKMKLNELRFSTSEDASPFDGVRAFFVNVSDDEPGLTISFPVTLNPQQTVQQAFDSIAAQLEKFRGQVAN